MFALVVEVGFDEEVGAEGWYAGFVGWVRGFGGGEGTEFSAEALVPFGAGAVGDGGYFCW